MDSGHKILSIICAGLLLYILFLNGCGESKFINGSETIVSIDTVTHETVYDTTWYDTTVFKYITVKVPKPYYDTTIVYESKYSANDFDQIMKHPSIYEDSTIKNDTIQLSYRATVRGYLDKMELGYKIVKPFLVESTTITDIEITKVKRPWSVYAGFDVGANSSGLIHLAPMIELVMPKMSLGAGYDLNDQAFVIGAKMRISFRKKPNIIPRP